MLLSLVPYLCHGIGLCLGLGLVLGLVLNPIPNQKQKRNDKNQLQ